MFVHRVPRKMFVLLLLMTAAAVLVGARLGGSVAASYQPVLSAGSNQGNPRAVPPLLPPATPSELALIRQVEAREAAASAYHVSASARYSLAELNAYASASK